MSSLNIVIQSSSSDPGHLIVCWHRGVVFVVVVWGDGLDLELNAEIVAVRVWVCDGDLWPHGLQTQSSWQQKWPRSFSLTEKFYPDHFVQQKSLSYHTMRVRWLAAVSVPPTSQSTNHTPGETLVKRQGVAVRSPPLPHISLFLILTLLIFILVIVGGTWGASVGGA